MEQSENKSYKSNICQEFFIERLKEALHLSTLDSYRVRTHNAHTLMHELSSLIKQWRKGNIKQFETLELCAKEAKLRIEEDTVYLSKYPHKNVLIDYLETFAKEGKTKPSLCDRTHHLLEEILESDYVRVYKHDLLNEIKKLTILYQFAPTQADLMIRLSKLDSMISNLCTELIFSGFSKSYLYSIAKNFQEKDFSISFEDFVRIIEQQNKKQYIIIFKLTFSKYIEKIPLLDFSDKFPDKYRTEWLEKRRANFIRSHSNQKFHSIEVEAYDETSAIKSAKEQLGKLLDCIHFSLHNSMITPSLSVMIIEKIDGELYAFNSSTLPILDDINQEEEISIEDVINSMSAFKQSSNISPEIENRLSAALRHLRIGDTDTEIEQRFINYWIALEFLFSTPNATDSTFTRIKEILVNILVTQYAKRNLFSLDNQIQKLVPEYKDIHLWDSQGSKIINTQGVLPILLEYRINKFKQHLLSKNEKEIRKYLELHKQNVSWHIARIYRLRNELIHEAAIKQNIEDLTSNLRYYLIFTLNQIVQFFRKVIEKPSRRKFDMETFFMHYEILKRAIEKHPTLDLLFQMNKKNK